MEWGYGVGGLDWGVPVWGWAERGRTFLHVGVVQAVGVPVEHDPAGVPVR